MLAQTAIVVPLDGSPLSEQALPLAQSLACQLHAPLLLTRVVARDDPQASEARTYLQRVAAHSGPPTTLTQLQLASGERDVAVEVLRTVEAAHAQLLVMATHGRSGVGRWLYGSVADAILRQAPVPVLLVAPGMHASWPEGRPPRILVPLDGSKHSEAVMDVAARLANRLRAEVILTQIIMWPPLLTPETSVAVAAALDEEEQLIAATTYLDGMARRLEARGVRARVHADFGQHPSATLARIAQDERVDLIAMATHGRQGMARAFLGSVATGTLQRAPVPVLIVHPESILEQEQAVGVHLDPDDVARLEEGVDELLTTPARDPALAAEMNALDEQLSLAEAARA